MPPTDFGASWEPVVDSADPVHVAAAKPIDAAQPVTVEARSVLVLRALPVAEP